jgi:hypothetical protein
MATQSSRSGRLHFGSKVRLGTSGIGTVNQHVGEQLAEPILERRAYAPGIRNFDTAPFYGHGLSELRLGRFLRERVRSSFTVSTKVGRILVPPRGESFDRGIWAAPLELKPVFDYSYEGTLRSNEQSANRLGFPISISSTFMTSSASRTPMPTSASSTKPWTAAAGRNSRSRRATGRSARSRAAPPTRPTGMLAARSLQEAQAESSRRCRRESSRQRFGRRREADDRKCAQGEPDRQLRCQRTRRRDRKMTVGA